MTLKILVAGCGALGSQIAYNLAAPNLALTLLDFDTVGENNVLTGTSVFDRDCLGVLKTEALAALVYRRYRVVCNLWTARLTTENAHRLSEYDVVIDGFDNAEARQLTGTHPNVLHVGVSAGDSGGAWWNAAYPMPAAVVGENPVCTNALGRRLIYSTAA
jgi:hypothetical protein